MSDIVVERAVFHRDRGEEPRLLARSSTLLDRRLGPLADILVAFGERPAGVACPGAVFAQPLGDRDVVVVHVADSPPGPTGWAGLLYQCFILGRREYDHLGGDPFALARAAVDRTNADAVAAGGREFSATASTSAAVAEATALRLPARPQAQRGLDEVRAVLKRIKAHALPENADPEKPPPLTVDNAESPTLLGGAQVLVDGGKIVFERRRPDASVVEALWTLLPHGLRPRIWPASFAFANDLRFDVLVVPNVSAVALEGYTTEEQAGDYPQGTYELALQTAVETGDADGLETVLCRRTSGETMWLGIKLLAGLVLLVGGFRLLTPPSATQAIGVADRAAAAAGVVAVGDPWTACWMIDTGNRLFRKR